MLVCPRIEFKTIERHALRANSNYGDVWADFAIEPVLAHAEVKRRVSEAEEARERGALMRGRHAWRFRLCGGLVKDAAGQRSAFPHLDGKRGASCKA
jgi:hypothetical protein